MQVEPSSPRRLNRYFWLLLIVWLLGLWLDRWWLQLDHGVPSHAATQQLNQMVLVSQPLLQNVGVAPPLPMYVGWVSQQFFGRALDQLLWGHAVYTALLVAAVYGIGRCLFSRAVGLWSAGFGILLPMVVSSRLEFGQALPLVTLTLVSWWRLLVWRQGGVSIWPSLPDRPTPEPEILPWDKELQLLKQTISRRTEAASNQQFFQWWEGLRDWRDRWFVLPQLPRWLQPWGDAVLLGLSMGLALLTHPLAVVYLVVPFVWAGFVMLLRGRWWRSCQWVLAGVISWTIAWPWYRASRSTLVLDALQRSQLWTEKLWRWNSGEFLQHLGWLVQQAFYPLVLVGGVGLLLYQQRVVTQVSRVRPAGISGAMRHWRRQVRRTWMRSVGWIFVTIAAALMLGAIFLPANELLLLPLLLLFVILLVQGVLLFPANFFQIRWFLLLLTVIWSVSNLFPLVPLRAPQQLAQPVQNWHQDALLETVMQADPERAQVIGLVPQTEQYNADYLTYLAQSKGLPMVATTVGQDEKQVWQDRRSLPWYVLLQSDKSALARAVRSDQALSLNQTWKLPNNQYIQLFRRQEPLVQVTPIVGAQWSESAPIRLEKVELPTSMQPGKLVPVTYTWSGLPKELQHGLVQLTWRWVNDGKSVAVGQWWHDHGIGLGQVASDTQAELMQVQERLAMVVPAGAVGRYQLEALYLDTRTGKSYALDVPDVSAVVGQETRPAVSGEAIPELDLVAQLRSLSRSLLRSPNLQLWQQVVGRLDRYDPQQRTLEQLRLLTVQRLLNDPGNPGLYADLALVAFLQRDMVGAVAALERLAQLQPKNYLPQFYLAIVQATRGQGSAAQDALKQVQELQPELVVPEALQTLVAAAQWHPLAQWKLYRLRLDLMAAP